MQYAKATPGPDVVEAANGERLESWKEIAAHLRHSVRTVKRWEKAEAMPVHRHPHNKLASVYAYRSEIDAWWTMRRTVPTWHREGNNGAPPFVQVAESRIVNRVPCILTAAALVLLFNLLIRLLMSR